MKVLFLSLWYPNKFDAMAGLFVKKHAEAISLFANVDVLYIHASIEDRYYSIEDKYVNENFSVKFNGKNIDDKKLILKRKKVEDITVWLYYEIKYKPELKNVEIKNSLMTDLYRDQTNLLIFTYKKKQKALTFNSKNKIHNFSF